MEFLKLKTTMFEIKKKKTLNKIDSRLDIREQKM